jgi:hypothetical protein
LPGGLFFPPNQSVLSITIAAKRADIALTISLGVMLTIFVDAAKFRAIAVVGIIVTPARAGIERLAFPHILTGYLSAILETHFSCHVHAMAKTVIAITVAIVVVVVVRILGSRVAYYAGKNCTRQQG